MATPEPHRQKIVTSVYLTDGQLARLRSLSGETGAPVAELVRRAIDAYLAARQRPQASL